MMTHYDILGVPAGADIETIRKAYRAALKKYHPDLHDGDPAAEVHSKRIIDAYNVLKDPDQRVIYDEELTRRAQQRRRLFLITLLVGAGVSCGSSFALFWSWRPPAEITIAALPSPKPAARPEVPTEPAAGRQAPQAPQPAVAHAPIPAPTQRASRAEGFSHETSEPPSSAGRAAVSKPPSSAELGADKRAQVAEAAGSPAPASVPEQWALAESAPAASASDASVTLRSPAGEAAPAWLTEGGEGYSSASAPDLVVEGEEHTTPGADRVLPAPAQAAGTPVPSEPAPAAAVETLAGAPLDSIPPLLAQPVPESRQQLSWDEVENSRDVELVWKFIEEAPSAHHAVLATRRLEELIETSEDVVSLGALRAAADGAIAEQIQRRLDALTGPKDIVTGTIGEPAEASSAQVAPAPGSADTPSLSAAPTQEAPAGPPVSAQPGEAEKHVKSGLAALKAGNIEKAIAAFDTAIRFDNSNARAFLNRASAWESKGDQDQALADYNTAIGLDPSSAAALQSRGLLLSRRGEFDPALLDLDKAIRMMNFSNAKAYRDRGTIWLEMGRYNRAITDFSRALSIDPDLASAYVGRGRAFMKKGDTVTASVNFDKASRRDASAAKEYRELMKAQTKKDASVQQAGPSLR